ncbi:MAG: bifunctional 3,4-dihydroxy-2-butanone-4-phosphate synthase/GTP cyclohydrolase II [Chloroflexi bacterium]|nr:MAG: bifunctional 3,4-dihydroxy-2-butanone-4-phosphate synthase/GTP cyclohydrolase II [Chloroflexota bacterium]TMD56655.1 MAG: bifunctional 3,4-dihydroxy-2-butanone-4-phosphate synthase/GTP cyclohydrolase II [Chloroflexota bacterium]
MPLATIPEAIEEFKSGRPVIIVDDEDRENEGDLAMAAEKVTPEWIAFMAKTGGGLICMPCIASRLDELDIEPMVTHNTSRFGTAFSVSIEARHLVTTGISAYDRAATIRHVLDPTAKASDFSKPGHTFPLRSAEGGVLMRAGQTEAAVDLARMAGLYPAGVICEVMNDDGTMARMPDLELFAKKHELKIVAIKDLIAYRRRNEKQVECMAITSIPNQYGNWRAFAYEDVLRKESHLALVLGEIDAEKPTLLRVHSECLTGDVFGSLRCDCGDQLERAMELIAAEGSGVILYIKHHEGRGIGLIDKLRAYSLQDSGMDTVEANEALGHPADKRDYGIGAQILYDLGVRKMRILTNSPRKYHGVEGIGLEVVEQVPIKIDSNPHNARYLQTKKDKLGHLL